MGKFGSTQPFSLSSKFCIFGRFLGFYLISLFFFSPYESSRSKKVVLKGTGACIEKACKMALLAKSKLFRLTLDVKSSTETCYSYRIAVRLHLFIVFIQSS